MNVLVQYNAIEWVFLSFCTLFPNGITGLQSLKSCEISFSTGWQGHGCVCCFVYADNEDYKEYPQLCLNPLLCSSKSWSLAWILMFRVWDFWIGLCSWHFVHTSQWKIWDKPETLNITKAGFSMDSVFWFPRVASLPCNCLLILYFHHSIPYKFIN